MLLLQVEDSGPGVPEAERELVFQPFYRALGSEADGSGLGLPIVLEIASKHDAEVTLEDARAPARPARRASACGLRRRTWWRAAPCGRRQGRHARRVDALGNRHRTGCIRHHAASSFGPILLHGRSPYDLTTRRFANTHPDVVIGNFPGTKWSGARCNVAIAAQRTGGWLRGLCPAMDAASGPSPPRRSASRRPLSPGWAMSPCCCRWRASTLKIDPHAVRFCGPWAASAPRADARALAPEDHAPIGVVLISHNHYDHLCFGTCRLRDAGQSPRFVVPLGLADWFTPAGHGPHHRTELVGAPDIAPGVRVVFTRRSTGAAAPRGTQCLAVGRVPARMGAPPTAPSWRFLFPGDTGCSEDFKAIRQRLGPVDFLALPIGAYLPRDFMKPMHVNPEDAVQLMLDVEARRAMGVHWARSC